MKGGTLIQLTMAKKTTPVPTKTSRGRRWGMTYTWNGGPPALATMLVKPATVPQNKPAERFARTAIGALMPDSTTSLRIANITEISPSASDSAASDTCAAKR